MGIETLLRRLKVPAETPGTPAGTPGTPTGTPGVPKKQFKNKAAPPGTPGTPAFINSEVKTKLEEGKAQGVTPVTPVTPLNITSKVKTEESFSKTPQKEEKDEVQSGHVDNALGRRGDTNAPCWGRDSGGSEKTNNRRVENSGPREQAIIDSGLKAAPPCQLDGWPFTPALRRSGRREIPLPTAAQQKASLECFAKDAISPTVRETAKEELQKIATKEVPAVPDSETPPLPSYAAQAPSTPVSSPELRAAVLRQLADFPETTSALVITDTSADPVVVGYGLRDAATCELAIPRARFNAEELQRAFPDTSLSMAGAVAATVEAFSQPPKPPPNDGLGPDAREALGEIRKLAKGKSPIDALAVANAMLISTTAISGVLVELERKRLIHPGDWSRCGTKIKLVTH